ncbi:hypothetical protein D3C76_1703840 [compost metagenome]
MAMVVSAGVPGSTTSRAIRSASITSIPRVANWLATVVLPLPIPPVIATTYIVRAPLC